MTALTGKVTWQVLLGIEVGITPLVITPIFNLLALICAVIVIKNIENFEVH